MSLDASLEYFVEWGGEGWRELVATGVREFLGERLDGRQVLDIGTRSGRMSCLFALMGAQVTGIDIGNDFVPQARLEAAKWGVEQRTTFVPYNGDLDIFADGSFDVIFTKSVLVVVPDLDGFVAKIERKLKPCGKAVFVENRRGDLIVRILRRIRASFVDYGTLRCFTQREVAVIGRVLDVELVRTRAFPPVYLICASKGKSLGCRAGAARGLVAV
jgi:SAM-dependent methyltransferase